MRERVAVGVRREQKPKKINLEGFSAGCVEQNGENGGKKKMEANVCWKSGRGRKKNWKREAGEMGNLECPLEVGGSQKKWGRRKI